MVCEIVQGSRRRQFLSDLGHGRIGRVATRPTDTLEAAIASVEVGGHFAVITVLADVEPHVPVTLNGFHASMVDPTPQTDQSTTSLHRTVCAVTIQKTGNLKPTSVAV